MAVRGEVSADTTPSRGGREMAVWLVVCAAGAGLAWLAAGRDWGLPAAGAVTVNRPVAALTGDEVAAWLTPVALAALAGCVAVLATRGVWRSVVGVLVALCGAGVVAAGLQAYGTAVLDRTYWPVAAVAGGALLLVGGLVTALRGRRWAGMSARYSRTPDDSAPSARRLWDALDEGLDPTAEQEDHR
ncbi:Trp biosynthesis-associated membrane protein [Acrocarpospora catenulata]|uniref:Trp biosynthesis-associated membrane protein n=1 Tax=Acrocarpospora catenulata TaxID=2836182 RepID=UPI00202396B4|nr:Trp biosynthesis-associated membrane protein [Acrocarpospora catenulata]